MNYYKYLLTGMLIVTNAVVFCLGVAAGALTVNAPATVESVDTEIITLTLPTPEPTPTARPEPASTVTYAPLPTSLIDPRPREVYVSLGEFRLTAYCGCSKCCGKWGKNRPIDANGRPIVYTANQSIAVEGLTVAADISLLPYGTEIYIDGHRYEVQDCGGAIKGKRLDIYFERHTDAWAFGVQYKEVFKLMSISYKRKTIELITN